MAFRDGAVPPGALAVEGVVRHPAQKRRSSTTPDYGEVAWHWDVPERMQTGLLMNAASMGWPHESDEEPNYSVRIVQNPTKFDTLYLFDAKTGLRWQRDLMPLQKKDAFIGFASTPDGEHTLLVLDPLEEKAENGAKIMVLNAQGHMVSSFRLPGIRANHLERNRSGNSFSLRVTIAFVDDKPNPEAAPDATVHLNRNGQIVGVFVDAKDKPVDGNGFGISADDFTAGFSDKGLLYRLP